MVKTIKFKNQYYEAILQLRPADEKVLDFVEKVIEKRENIFIAKIVVLKTGMDVYLSSNKFAVQLGKLLKKKFNGEIKVTKSLFSRDRQTMKSLYRLTVLFRLKEE